MINMRRLTLSALLIICFCNCGHASVSSVEITGGSYIVSGSSFGAKTLAPPKGFYDFEGTVGQAIVETGLNDQGSNFSYAQTAHGGSSCGYVSVETNDSGGGGESYLWHDYGAGQDTVYWSFWAKINLIQSDPDGVQIKFYSVRSYPYVSETNSGFGSFPWFKDQEFLYTRDVQINLGGYTGSYKYWPSPDNGVWFRVEYFGKRNSSDGAADGEWHINVINPTTGVTTEVWHDTSATTHVVGDADWRYLTFKNDIENSTSKAKYELWLDDWYCDTTRQRVEIGNAPVFANCTHREIQPALTWSDTGITGTFNQGSFEKGDTVYFFVIDEDGVPSDGYPVTIGEDPSIANPVVEILTESGQTTTASIFTITGTATSDNGQTISGVTCSGQTVTPNDGTWDEQVESFTCLANLSLGENVLIFIGSDGTRTGSDSVTITRTIPGEYTTRGAGYTIKGCSLK